MIKQRLFLFFAQLGTDDVNLPNEGGLRNDTFTRGLQLAFGFAGGIALLVVAIGGLRYVLSQGDPSQTAKAKDTILYALVGLAVCIGAIGIIQFLRAEGAF